MMVTRAPLRAARLVQLRSSMGSVESGGLAKARPEKGGELVIGGAYGLAADDASGVKLDSE